MGFDIIETQILGESHSPDMKLNFFGLKKGSTFAGDSVLDMLERRKSSHSPWSTPRLESDEPIFAFGLEENKDGEVKLERGKTYTVSDDVVCARIENNNVKTSDYDNISLVPRPSHADYVQFVRDGKIASGGGRFSGRLTSMLCIAGGIAEDILKKHGIEVVAYVSNIGDVALATYKDGVDVNGLDKAQIERVKSADFPTLDDINKEQAVELVKKVAKDGDSVGGTIECVVLGVTPGALGDNLTDGLESKIAYSVFGVPAVKGIEFGSGFELAKMRGSKANDEFCFKGDDIKTLTNNSGGINGGISNGMPITLRVVVKPTPSVSKEQKSVNLLTNEPAVLSVKGRHDACIVPRAVPCIESAVALALLDELFFREIAEETL